MKFENLLALSLAMVMSLYAPPADPGEEPGADLAAKLIDGAKEERELNLVGGGGTWGEMEGVKRLEKAFNRRFGLNASIKFTPGPSMPDMARRITDEFKAGQKSGSDLYIGSESHFIGLIRANALMGFPWRQAFPHIPQEMIELDGRIVREGSRFIGISYNHRLVSERDLPERLDDLLKPIWKGRIASTPYAASFDRVAQVIGEEKTRAFLQRFSQNVAGLIRCGEDERLASGEFVMLALNCGNYDAERARRQGMPISAKTLIDIPILGYWYLAVPKHSSHPNLAALFAGFLLTKEAQEIRFETVGATAHLIEGTPANREYKDLSARGAKLKDFTAEYVLRHGKTLGRLREDFQRILQKR